MTQTNESQKIPDSYKGREQTWIKHCVLKAYLGSWANKIASASKSSRPIRLWYIDTFAGPWESSADRLEDTSIAIGLEAIKSAASFWNQAGQKVEIGAIFIEKDKQAFQRLQQFLAADKGTFQKHAFHGTFGQNLEMIERIIADDPAFCFVDPKGWKGADMKFIKRLTEKPKRDVMINFMYDYVNRFKDHRVGSQHSEMSNFFGAEIPENLDEENLMKFYRSCLKTNCGLQYAADLIVLDPLRDRTKFRIVVGGNHVKVLELFRDIEKRVVHKEAPRIRLVAKEEERVERTGQFSLFSDADADPNLDFEQELKDIGLNQARVFLPQLFEKMGPKLFSMYYPEILQECHINLADLKKWLWELREANLIQVDGVLKGQKTIK
ncbi:MAG: three-Cys-motif partner protein TcmP, partial [Pseudobdellovibrionaceae bacterium]